MDMTFPRRYECREVHELPGASAFSRYYYPGASQKGGRDGVIIEVQPEQEKRWLGIFAFGRISAKGVSGVFTTPDPQRLCVVARGEGYLVRADDPSVWELVEASPIFDVRPIRAQGVLVFADYTRLIAYGQTGLKWRTKHLAWDGLTITEVTDELISGEFEDVSTGSTGTFSVDLATGKHTGGMPTF